MTVGNERFRPIETAPKWSHEVFDTCAGLGGLLERHSYRFARTMPGAPHSYTPEFVETGEMRRPQLPEIAKARAGARASERGQYKTASRNGI